SALYITSNLLIYFFKYDVGGADWASSHMLFNMVGGASQILSMMALYPILRRKMTNEAIFKLCLILEIIGYALILIACFTGLANNMFIICGAGLFVFLANGILTVLTTVFLSATVDYGELKTGKREESVIFSMQTFVVKLASGLAVFLCGLGLKLIGLVGDDSTDGGIVQQSAGTITGLRILMTVLPIIGLFVALYVFKKKFLLTDEKIVSMNTELNARREG
ncbi:MAG: MFS transporter, partial [Solobacterium sp.]|nr:MFS transporter [Solobacterium sp.]